MKAIIDNKIPYIQGLIEQLVDEAVYLPGADISASDVADADILIVRTRTLCNRDLLDGSRVRLIVTATIGYDHLDTEYLQAAGIGWTNCPGCNAGSVRQYVHNVLLCLAPPQQALRIGIVGVGHVGSLVADDLLGAGHEVMLCDPPLEAQLEAHPEADVPLLRTQHWQHERPAFHTLEQLADACDVITFHPYLSTDGPHPTYHLASDDFFSRLRRRPIVINSSRGAVVDNAALLRAIRSAQVGRTAIDTWEDEPHVLPELLEAVDIATPHIAGYSADGKANATRMSLEAVARFLQQPFTLSVQPPALPDGFCYGPDATDGPLRLYDPRVDSDRLKARPDLFEHFRGNYPLRREQV